MLAIAAGVAGLKPAPALAQGTTPPGTDIQNIAYVAYIQAGQADTVRAPSNLFTVTTVAGRTPATLEILSHAPEAPDADLVTVSETAFSPSGNREGPFVTLPPPGPSGLSPLDLRERLPLRPASVLRRGEPVFLRLRDPDQDLDPGLEDWVVVVVTVPALGEREVLRLTETGVATGTFTGFVDSRTDVPITTHDGVLTVAVDVLLEGDYSDPADPDDTAHDEAWIDPVGVVFDSRSGEPVAGAVVRLVHAATGEPAIVFGDDGVAAFPAEIAAGSTVTDGGGGVYTFPPGGYRFPQVPVGTYRLEINAPSGYRAPSSVATPSLQQLPGAPFEVAEPGSRGEAFQVAAGTVLGFDVPLDPAEGVLLVEKEAGVHTAAVGDFVGYTLRVTNLAANSVRGARVEDTLPLGFRYEPGSARMTGADSAGAGDPNRMNTADPQMLENGRTLNFALPDLGSGHTVRIHYVVEVGARARLGDAVNRARARDAAGTLSNEAQAVIHVTEDLFRSRSMLVGTVTMGACGADTASGLAGVRVLLENGTTVITDRRGRFHFEGLRPGSHVVRLDPGSLPSHVVLAECDTTFRDSPAGSRLVNLQGGTVWREDFRVEHRPPPPPPAEPPRGSVDLELSNRLGVLAVDYGLGVQVNKVPVSRTRVSLALPEGATYRPGSSRRNGTVIPDPEIQESVLTYRLGEVAVEDSLALTLTADIDPRTGDGDLVTKAFVLFNSPGATGLRSPVVENAVILRSEEERVRKPDIVLRPRFPTLGTKLGAEDRQQLDTVVETIRTRNIMRILVTGHSDNVPISVRARDQFEDNYALSRARAESVAEYLKQALIPLKPEFVLEGVGPDQPVDTNRTREGRRQNRRVELRLITETVTSRSTLASGDTGSRTSVPTEGVVPIEAPATPEKAPLQPPRLDEASIAKCSPGTHWLWPPPGYSPPIPSIRVMVQHEPEVTPELVLEGKPVSPLNYEGVTLNAAGTVAVSVWKGIDVDEGDNRFAVNFPGNGATPPLERVVHYAGSPVTVELVPERSRLTADGRTHPVVAVRLRDRAGEPARPGVIGRFSVDPPHLPRREALEMDTRPLGGAPRVQYTVEEDGITWVELEPTSQSGEVVLRFPLASGEQEIRTWLEAEARDWILVGLAEGSAGYHTVTGNQEHLNDLDAEDAFYLDGRLAFYAQGRVKGSWLLTAAYDSQDNPDRDASLFEIIDPDDYYTLYGDATQQTYDAPSARRVYVRLERRQFYAMFGDFDTGLSVTELTRYQRRLNGVKSEMSGEGFGYTAFATETESRFARDEIRGNGTSGLYSLSRNDLVINSEEITLETRDRFRSERILVRERLRRHLDYDIDYAQGTLFFRSSVPDRDSGLNPVFIVITYESRKSADGHWEAGGRGSARFFGRRLELGGTVIHEDQDEGPGNLLGLDARYRLGIASEVRVEVAWSQHATSGGAGASLAEIERRVGRLTGQAYYRRHHPDFGLGQQNVSERGTEKFGLGWELRIQDDDLFTGQTYRQRNLETDAERDVAELGVERAEDGYAVRGGLRYAEDRVPGEEPRTTAQVTGGGEVRFLSGKLALHLDHDQSIASARENSDFPTRTVVGLDLRVRRNLSLFAAHEFTNGDLVNTGTTRFGLNSSPWRGAEITGSLDRGFTERGARVFATLGLRQAWKLSEQWFVDASLNRSATVGTPDTTRVFANVPPASGTTDFTAVSLGTSYYGESWQANLRAEVLDTDANRRWSVVPAVLVQANPVLSLAGGGRWFRTEGDDDARHADLRLGLAYRPGPEGWTVLNRLDFALDREFKADTETRSRRAVNNLNLNRRFRRWQLALQHGIKVVGYHEPTGPGHDGTTDLVGAELRYRLSRRWDLGMRTSLLHSWNSRLWDHQSGVSVGLSPIPQTWIQLGYNVTGFEDEDFSRGSVTAHGPFLRVSVMLDRDLLSQLGLGSTRRLPETGPAMEGDSAQSGGH